MGLSPFDEADEWKVRYGNCVQTRAHCMVQLERYKQAIDDCIVLLDRASRGSVTGGYAAKKVEAIIRAVDAGKPWVAPEPEYTIGSGGPS